MAWQTDEQSSAMQDLHAHGAQHAGGQLHGESEHHADGGVGTDLGTADVDEGDYGERQRPAAAGPSTSKRTSSERRELPRTHCGCTEKLMAHVKREGQGVCR